MNRREFVEKSVKLAASGVALGAGFADASKLAAQTSILSPASLGKGFPKNFLWGAATAAHQVEGNNVNSDFWMLEHMPKSMFREPSGDACDHYHLYEQDINTLADLGLNTYRFSIEWARIEPEKGAFSRAELEHYRRMLELCHRRGLAALVTYSHFSVPRWFALEGAWENPESSDLFARYCAKATEHLGDLIAYAATFNEPDIPYLFRWISLPGPNGGQSSDVATMMGAQKAALREQLHAPQFSSFFMGDAKQMRDNMLAAHTKGKAAIKAARSSMPVGLTLAMEDDQAIGPNSRAAEKQSDVYGPWLDLAKQDDYVGVQTYTRSRVSDKVLPPPPGAELTQMGYEFYPEALEHTVRYASKQTGVPVIVTENGIGTEKDDRRVEYIQRALAGVKRCIQDRIDVRGYIHWSLLDNFEWIFGYTPKFGLIAIDRENQKRTIKPSARLLGSIAKASSS